MILSTTILDPYKRIDHRGSSTFVVIFYDIIIVITYILLHIYILLFTRQRQIRLNVYKYTIHLTR